MKNQKPNNLLIPVIRTALIYIVLASAYILISDNLAWQTSSSLESLSHIQSIKGMLYVLVSGILIFFLLWRELKVQKDQWQKHQLEREKLLRELQTSNEEIKKAYEGIISSWSKALELRHHEMKQHADNVVDLTLRLAAKLGLDEEELVAIRRGAFLHDVGKMPIPDSILLKPGPLDAEERALIQKHPEYARQILEDIEHLKESLDIPLYHHERWDGSGYPHGLKGTDIPLAARIFAVVDVWDAMTSDRPYRSAIPEAEVLDHICNQSGKHFDPDIIETFLTIIENSYH